MSKVSTSVGEHKLYLVEDSAGGKMSLMCMRHAKLKRVNANDLVHMFDTRCEMKVALGLKTMTALDFIFEAIEKHGIEFDDYVYRDSEYILLSPYRSMNAESFCVKKDEYGRWVRIGPQKEVFQRLNIMNKISC